jgi:hypothetical protein
MTKFHWIVRYFFLFCASGGNTIVEWWCLFHLPKEEHANMFARFASWLKKDGVLEFTTGDSEYQASSSDMLNQELNF